MTPTEARATLSACGVSIADMVRLRQAHGDRRSEQAIRQGLQTALAHDRAEIPWYMDMIICLLAGSKKYLESDINPIDAKSDRIYI